MKYAGVGYEFYCKKEYFWFTFFDTGEQSSGIMDDQRIFQMLEKKGARTVDGSGQDCCLQDGDHNGWWEQML